jgi:hypothetical protein
LISLASLKKVSLWQMAMNIGALGCVHIAA